LEETKNRERKSKRLNRRNCSGMRGREEQLKGRKKKINRRGKTQASG